MANGHFRELIPNYGMSGVRSLALLILLIDPPFEVTDEFLRILSALKLALMHWRAGQYVIWYPIKNDKAVKQFETSLRTITQSLLFIHLRINHPVEPGKLAACGLALINPPWQLFLKAIINSKLCRLVVGFKGKLFLFGCGGWYRIANKSFIF